MKILLTFSHLFAKSTEGCSLFRRGTRDGILTLMLAQVRFAFRSAKLGKLIPSQAGFDLRFKSQPYVLTIFHRLPLWYLLSYTTQRELFA
jgi:hypothetical protein